MYRRVLIPPFLRMEGSDSTLFMTYVWRVLIRVYFFLFEIDVHTCPVVSRTTPEYNILYCTVVGVKWEDWRHASRPIGRHPLTS